MTTLVNPSVLAVLTGMVVSIGNVFTQSNKQRRAVVIKCGSLAEAATYGQYNGLCTIAGDKVTVFLAAKMVTFGVGATITANITQRIKDVTGYVSGKDATTGEATWTAHTSNHFAIDNLVAEKSTAMLATEANLAKVEMLTSNEAILEKLSKLSNAGVRIDFSML